MYRKKSLLQLIVCLLLVFSVLNLSYAGGNHDDIDKAETALDNAIHIMGIAVGSYDYLRDAMETLNSEYNSKKKEIEKGYSAAFTKACVAIVAGAAAVYSGGPLAPAVFVAYLAVFVAYLAVNDAFVAGSIDDQEYMDAMGTVLSLMDVAQTDVNTAYSSGGNLQLPETNSNGNYTGGTITVNVKGYINDYKAYLSAGAAHIGEDYESLYHKVQRNAGRVDSHSFEVLDTYKHFPTLSSVVPTFSWHTYGLSNDYTCNGICGNNFRSPHEAFDYHRVQCYDLTNAKFVGHCMDYWYSCDTDKHKKMMKQHKPRICTKTYTDFDGTSGPCGRGYKNCSNSGIDHDRSNIWYWETKHSDTGSSDDDQEANNPATPTYHACGVHESWQSGDHSHGTPACGDDTHAGYACQIGNAHTKLIASCSVTNGNGDSCTVTSYYECQSHTHQYPSPTATCANGHTYDPTNPGAVNTHITRTCRYSECGQTWEKCVSSTTPICKKPYRKRNGLKCWGIAE